MTAAIAVGADAIAPQTKSAFEQIAKAGDGAYASLLTGDGSGGASRVIARHIMRQSFGAQWRRQMDQFADIYFESRERGYFQWGGPELSTGCRAGFPRQANQTQAYATGRLSATH